MPILLINAHYMFCQVLAQWEPAVSLSELCSVCAEQKKVIAHEDTRWLLTKKRGLCENLIYEMTHK